LSQINLSQSFPLLGSCLPRPVWDRFVFFDDESGDRADELGAARN
jgi:hypothetical protein